jgi:hypothetical protein
VFWDYEDIMILDMPHKSTIIGESCGAIMKAVPGVIKTKNAEKS